jgi:amidophosphoribosyltransferase
MCGFLGIINSDSAVREIYDGLVAVQHRGQDAAGIVTFDGRFHLKKGEGLVRDIFSAGNIERLKGGIGIGHVRYPTVGSGGGEDAQPFVLNYPYGVVMAHNGNVANYYELRQELEERESRHIDSGCDVEVIQNIFAGALEPSVNGKFDIDVYYRAVAEVFRRVQGSYSVVGMIAGQGLYAFRDPYGIKPIAFGRRTRRGKQSLAIASESVVLDLLGFEDVRTPAAGEAIFIDMAGEVHTRQISEPETHPCLFEFVYFARPDSLLDGVSVYHSRIRMGERLADKIRRLGLEIDVVVPVPDSARTAAQAIATELGLPFREGLVKNRYIGRTFIMPDDDSRRRSVRHKLNTIRSVFEGKRVLLVDDSIVRGHTSRTIIEMVRRVGAHKVYFASTAPPIRYPCVYGIDMQTRSEFVARDRTPDEVSRVLGADLVIYQTLADLERSVLAGNPQLKSACNACFSGSYPTGDVTPEMLEEIENERINGTDRSPGDSDLSGPGSGRSRKRNSDSSGRSDARAHVRALR